MGHRGKAETHKEIEPRAVFILQSGENDFVTPGFLEEICTHNTRAKRKDNGDLPHMKASSGKRYFGQNQRFSARFLFPNLDEWELAAINWRADSSNIMKNDPRKIFRNFGF